MGLQIVTGYTGTAHIKSAHDRARNAGTVGTGSYVMKTGNMLAAKMQSANTLRIVDGDLMMQGVHATVEAGTHEDLTIDNGTQGKKRNDLVVARYERLAGEPKTESVTLRVIKGEPSDGAAADPAHTEGDILGGDLVAEMPLYRVPIDGITPGEPVALFETVPTIAELRDSVSQYTTKSFTSAAKSLRYGAVADFDTSVKYDGYTPVCLTAVKSNHAGSCIITQFGLRDNGTAYASIQNNETTNRGTWGDLKITITVLYRKTV